MKKFIKFLTMFTLGMLVVFAPLGVKSNNKENRASADTSPLVANVTLTANDETRGDVDCEIILNKDLDVPASAIKFEYRTIESDEEIYTKFKKSYKELTSQAKIGKIVYIKLSCPDYPEVDTYLQTAKVKLRVYMPTFLLNKGTYFVDFAYSPDSSVQKFLNDDVTIEDKNFVVYEMNMSKEGCYVALVYDGSATIVVICIVAFLIILAFCIYLKIRKMHKEDPEYYEALKREKAQKKAMRKGVSAEQNKLTKSNPQTTANGNKATTNKKATANSNASTDNSNKKNKPTPKQVKRKY